MTPNIPIVAWAPDSDPTQPGVLVDVNNLVPTRRGYAPEFGFDAVWTSTPLPLECCGAGAVELASGVSVTLGATAAKIYDIGGGGLGDVSRTSGGAYADVSPALPWRFAAFQNVALAVHPQNSTQASTNISTTPFSNLTAAPRASTIAVQRNFVLVANLTTPTIQPDGWACSKLEDYTDWTPDIATESAAGRLTATPGPILRLIAYRDNVIAFKDRGVYRGTYVGAAENTWAWPLVSTEIGLLSHDAVCEAEGVLYWMGRDGFYRWAGGAIERIQSAPWGWLRTLLNTSETPLAPQCVFDPVRRVVRWTITTLSSATNRTVLSYHIDTDRWGRSTLPIQWAFTWHRARAASIENASRLWFNRIPGYVRSDDLRLVAHYAEPVDSTFTTGDIGDDDQAFAIVGARARFLTAPTSSYVEHSYRMNLGDSLQSGEVSQRVDGKYDLSQSARWHRLRFTQTGRYEVSGLSVNTPRAGKR